MVGCNEPQLPGGIFMGGTDFNVAKSVEHTFVNRREDVLCAKSFEEFFEIYQSELNKDIDEAVSYYNKFQSVRARDVNLVSTMFFEGSIERAKSITQGGAKNAIAAIDFIGLVTIIDSLSVVKQFVFDEKKITMAELASALDANWEGYEALHADIRKNAHFFGNNDDISNECAALLAKAISDAMLPRISDMGYHFLTGNLIGYNQHNKWFGDHIGATPDGRYAGDQISYGISQNLGRDREGITALLSSVARMNSYPVFCGATVTNVMMEANTINNDVNFERAVDLFETYFKMGGLHFQPNYISPEELIAAQKDPEKYRSLRVRVSGFSDYFHYLNKDLQDEIITRTELSV